MPSFDTVISNVPVDGRFEVLKRCVELGLRAAQVNTTSPWAYENFSEAWNVFEDYMEAHNVEPHELIRHCKLVGVNPADLFKEATLAMYG